MTIHAVIVALQDDHNDLEIAGFLKIADLLYLKLAIIFKTIKEVHHKQ